VAFIQWFPFQDDSGTIIIGHVFGTENAYLAFQDFWFGLISGNKGKDSKQEYAKYKYGFLHGFSLWNMGQSRFF